MEKTRILIATIPEKGHINPMIGIAQQLQKMGYELFFFSQTDTSAQLRKAGLYQKVYSDPAAVNISQEFVTKGREFVERLADKPWLRHWIKTLLIDAIPDQMQLLSAALEDCRPDLIVTDPMIYAAVLTAARLNIPWVGVSSSLNPITPDEWHCELTDTIDSFRAQRDQLFISHRAIPKFKVSDAISPWLNIVFSTEEYMPRELCKNDFSFYVGNSFPEQDRGDEAGFPFARLLPHTRKVYMSMGSQIYYHPQLFDAVAKALTDDNIQLVFSINELYHTPFLQQLPPQVIAVPYAPQLKVLPHMHLVITHGGANSVMESLAHGIPVALLPICNDQFLQTQFVTRAGVGIVMDPHNVSPAAYRDQLLPLLKDTAPQRTKAKTIGRSFQQHHGPAEAAALIQQLIHTRTPLMP